MACERSGNDEKTLNLPLFFVVGNPIIPENLLTKEAYSNDELTLRGQLGNGLGNI